MQNAVPETDVQRGTPAGEVPFRPFFMVWLRVALLSFGGPAGQIAVMHRIVVEEQQWISERRFLHALNYCMFLPGPEATQLATYVGWLLRSTPGGLLAGGLFVLPGFLFILAFSILYASFQDLGPVQGVFYGVKAAVLAVVVEAVLRIGRRVLHNGWMYALSAAAFIGIFFLDVPFPLIVLAAALAGVTGNRLRPGSFAVLRDADPEAEARPADAALSGEGAAHTRPSAARAVTVLAVWLPLWLVPPLALLLWLGPEDVFTQVGLFFSKLAVVTFGGAYAVLAYLAQETVHHFGWVTPGEMLDGLGMAETAPGPLIKVTQFVAYMGAFRDPGALDPVTAGVLASVLATWVTYVPCFLWIFLGAPYVESLYSRPALNAALSAITAAVVGVVLNLAVWFALHVVFTDVEKMRAGILVLHVPDPGSFDPVSLVLVAAACLAMLRWRVGMIPVIAASGALGLLLHGA